MNIIAYFPLNCKYFLSHLAKWPQVWYNTHKKSCFASLDGFAVRELLRGYVISEIGIISGNGVISGNGITSGNGVISGNGY